jgi:hypothetical protein
MSSRTLYKPVLANPSPYFACLYRTNLIKCICLRVQLCVLKHGYLQAMMACLYRVCILLSALLSLSYYSPYTHPTTVPLILWPYSPTPSPLLLCALWVPAGHCSLRCLPKFQLVMA